MHGVRWTTLGVVGWLVAGSSACAFDATGPGAASAGAEGETGDDCDTSTVDACWPGVSGQVLWKEGERAEFAGLDLRWSYHAEERVWLQRADVTPASETAFAGLTVDATCHFGGNRGIAGPASLDDLAQLDALEFESIDDEVLMVDSRMHPCASGLVVLRVDDRYAVLDFESMDFVDEFNSSMRVRYWVGDPGVTDFRGAPRN